MYPAEVWRSPAVYLRGLAVCASALVLAWSVAHITQGALDTGATEHRYSFAASTIRNPAAHANEIWLYSLTADERSLPLETVSTSGRWERMPFALAHKDDAQPASIDVTGRSITACFVSSPWSGIARVMSDGERIADLDLYRAATAAATHVCIELVDGHERSRRERLTPLFGSLRLVMASSLVAVLLLAWHPWRTAARFEAWAVVYVSALHLLVWLTQTVGYTNDSLGYVEGIAKWWAGHLSYHPPGYAWLLAPVWTLFPGAFALTATAMQHVIIVGALLAISRVARVALGPDLAILGFLLAGTAYPMLLIPQSLLSETAALAAMAGALWLACVHPTARTWPREGAAGVFAGWGGVARVIPLIALAAPLFLVMDADVRTALRRGVRMLAVAMAVVGVAAAWHLIGAGRFALSEGSGLHVYNRVVAEQGLIDRDGPATQELERRLGDIPPRGEYHWIVQARLEATGMAADEIYALLMSVGLEGLRSDPWAFTTYTLAQAWRQYGAIAPLRAGAETFRVDMFETTPPLDAGAGATRWINTLASGFRSSWGWLRWFPFLGLLLIARLPRPRVFVAFLVLMAVHMVAGAATEAFEDRYVVCVVPFALILAPVPLTVFVRRT